MTVLPGLRQRHNNKFLTSPHSIKFPINVRTQATSKKTNTETKTLQNIDGTWRTVIFNSASALK